MNFLSEPKVTELEPVIAVNENVLELDVAMSILCLGVKGIQSTGNLLKEIGDELLILNWTLFSDDVEEIHSAQFSRHIVYV